MQTSDGQYKSLLKLLRKDSIGSYSWDTSDSAINGGKGINQWGESGSYEGADLMRELNYDYLGSYSVGSYWYDGRNNQRNSYKTSTTISSTAQNMIQSVVWKLGSPTNYYGSLDESYYDTMKPSTIYSRERGSYLATTSLCYQYDYCNDTVTRTATWTGKIALPYQSDWLYSSSGGTNISRSTCINSSLNSWVNDDVTECKENEWFTNNSGYFYALDPITNGISGYLVGTVIWRGSQWGFAYQAIPVKPALYLKSTLKITGGSGTKTDPYILSQ